MTTAGGRITAGVGANLIGQHSQDRNQEATCYVGNLDEQITDELLWELFTQAGPVSNIYVPKDRVTNKHKGHAFIEFKGEEDAEYAIKVLNMIKVYGKPIRVNKASQEKKALDVGANLFIGNLDPDVDEKMLYDTFSAFGVIVATPKIMRDPDSGISKGFGFVSFDNFESSDAAIEAMHGQFLMNRSISAQYAFKKDSNERHGTPEERLMAQNYRMAAINSNRPNTMFAAAPSAKHPAQPEAGNPHPSGIPVHGGPPLPIRPLMNAPVRPMPAPLIPGIAPPPSAPVSSNPGLLTLPIPGAPGSSHTPPPPPWQPRPAPTPTAVPPAPPWQPQPAAAPPPPWQQRATQGAQHPTAPPPLPWHPRPAGATPAAAPPPPWQSTIPVPSGAPVPPPWQPRPAAV